MTSPVGRRASNLTSDSFERQSIRSSADELFSPSVARPTVKAIEKPSHLHAAPLVLALLPPLGGLFFHNGSAMLTDVTILATASIFLYWSIMLPWDWYYLAQSIRIHDTPPQDSYFLPDDTIMEEPPSDSASATEAQTQPAAADGDKPSPTPAQDNAMSELRVHELLALLFCFLGPCLGTYLLHIIRSSLSRPSSSGLVGDYNLSIFLLAALLRPTSHIISLIQARTLHLQRTLAQNPHDHSSALVMAASIATLHARLDQLEAAVSSSTTNPPSSPQPQAILPTDPQLLSSIRKITSTDLDALNRAVRRYEKRATLSSMQTESRLRSLETQVQDALALAAAAERRSAGIGSGGSAMLLADFACSLVVVPIKWAWGAGKTVVELPGDIGAGIADWMGVRRWRIWGLGRAREDKLNGKRTGSESEGRKGKERERRKRRE